RAALALGQAFQVEHLVVEADHDAVAGLVTGRPRTPRRSPGRRGPDAAARPRDGRASPAARAGVTGPHRQTEDHPGWSSPPPPAGCSRS
ncbi:hypothetical protein, partial [Streptosporangium sandarakinum]